MSRANFSSTLMEGTERPLAVLRPAMSAIVPVHNNAAELSQCLAALANCDSRECELIVVDDQSTENIRDIAAQYGARYFRTPRRGGPALARNLGTKHALGEIFLFVDADVVVPPDTLDTVLQCFSEEPKLAAVFGSYDDAPTCTDFWSSFKNLLHHRVHQESNAEAVTFWAGCGAIRREAFEGLGGFDAEKYPTPSIEDVELGVRLNRKKQRIRLLKGLQVKHLKKWTPRTLWQTDIFQRAVPWSRLILQTGRVPNDLNLTWESRASAGLVASLAALVISLIACGLARSTKHVALIGSAAALDMALLVVLNWRLYGFFRRKRGVAFAIGAMMAHWLYLFYSGATFTACWIVETFKASFRGARPDLALEPTQHDPQ
jgi:GT2 family glycosyltransferase